MDGAEKIVIATYYWPPSGGAGVQRWLKLSRYLQEFNVDPAIITVEDELATYPVRDGSLLHEVPAGMKVIKTPTRELFHWYARLTGKKVPSAGFANESGKNLMSEFGNWVRGNLFIPDPRKPWNPYWTKVAQKLIDREGFRTILTTSPPHSTQLGGLHLKSKNPHIKWIADLRDPWTDIYYYHRFKHSKLAAAIDARYEKQVITRADLVLVVSESMRTAFLNKYPSINPEAIHVLPNGWDPADFPDEIRYKDVAQKLQLDYIGTMSDDYPIEGLLKALSQLNRPYSIRFTGSMPDSRRELIVSLLGDAALFSEYLPHHDAVKRMCQSDVLILIIPDHINNAGILTGKLFEYLGSGNEILCLGPLNGDAASIVKSVNAGGVFDYADAKGMSEWLNQVQPAKGTSNSSAFLEARYKFSRKEQARVLAELIKFT